MSVRASVVVVTYNSMTTIGPCLNALAESLEPVEVIIVDNASADATVDVVRRTLPAATVVAMDENVGFARACNIGARRATGRHLVMLNPDTEVTPEAIHRAADHLDLNPDIGVIGAATYYADGAINATCCFAQPSLWSTFTRAVGLSSLFRGSAWLNPDEMPGWDRRSERDVGAVTGCFFATPRALFDRLEGFDERFFMYSEDTDLSLRVQQAGLRCVHAPDVVVMHHGGRSDNVPAMKMVKVLRARGQFHRKHWSPLRSWIGARLIELTVLSRAVGTTVIIRLRPSGQPSKWPEVWRHRADWR